LLQNFVFKRVLEYTFVAYSNEYSKKYLIAAAIYPTSKDSAV